MDAFARGSDGGVNPAVRRITTGQFMSGGLAD